MSSRQASIWGTERAQMTDSIRRTVDLLNEYGPRFRRWRVAWSGGKDSTAVVTLLVYLIQSGQVKAPVDGLEVLYADTRMELPPLWLAAQDVRWDLEERGYPVRFPHLFSRGSSAFRELRKVEESDFPGPTANLGA